MNEAENSEQDSQQQTQPVEPSTPYPEQRPETITTPPTTVVLPARKYKLRIMLLFSDAWAALIFGYYFMIRNIVTTAGEEGFSWFSPGMISSYIVVGITLAVVLAGFILTRTRSIRTRIARDNELRQDRNISIWLTTFDWTWLILFVPTFAIAILCGIVGYIIDWTIPVSTANIIIHRTLGGVVFGFLCLNTAVVIFKLTPARVLLFVFAVAAFCLILLLMGVDIFLSFFEKFKYLGVRVDPLGYLLMAYVGFFFLRLIWISGLFEYIAMAPNRLDIQKGLSESEKGIQRKDFRISIDTEDVILRLFKVGRIIVSFPQSDRLPMSFLVTGIDKKSRYAMETASVVSIDGSA